MGEPRNKLEKQDERLDAPPRLVKALRKISQPPLFIPRAVDEAVLRAANLHFTKPEARRFSVWLLLRWATAAMVLLLLLAGVGQYLRRPGLHSTAGFAREDLNHDGTVDILDAFALARELKQGARPGPGQDVNADGAVDEHDVATLAARAVSLEKQL